MTRTGASDEELLARIAERDEDALEQFFLRFAPRLAGFLRPRLRDPAAIDDVINVVMLEVWNSAARFEGRTSAAGFVLSIARHRAIDRLRRRGSADRERELDDAVEDPGAPADSLLAAAADAERVRDCIEELPTAQREAVFLAYYEELPYHEIARAMDCPPGTVKTRVFHAKRSLKRCLERGPEIAHA